MSVDVEGVVALGNPFSGRGVCWLGTQEQEEVDQRKKRKENRGKRKEGLA